MKRSLAVLSLLILGCYLAECRTTQGNASFDDSAENSTEVFEPTQICNGSRPLEEVFQDILRHFGFGSVVENGPIAILIPFFPRIEYLYRRFCQFAKPFIARFYNQFNDLFNALKGSTRHRRCLNTLEELLGNAVRRVDTLLSEKNPVRILQTVLSDLRRLPNMITNKTLSLLWSITKNDVLPLVADTLMVAMNSGLLPANAENAVNTTLSFYRLLGLMGIL